MNAQSFGSLNQDSFGTPLWESREKKAIWMQVRQRATENIIWGKVVDSPRVRAVMSQVSPRSPVACPNTESVKNEF